MTAAREQIRRLAERLAVEEFGGEVLDEPIPGYQVLTRRRLVDPLPGVRAAQALAAAARGLLVEQSRDARAAGRSWDEIGQALGLSDSEADEPRAEAAFADLVEGRRPNAHWRAFRSPSTSWRCGSCHELVTDYGPRDSPHPDDQESGHADTCTRHRAALAQWRIDTGWDD
ncbi:hypothetical protein [Pseudonocardia oroxyli]|uniref:Uncharacterized protein n=1 Tax=Pseudonocardia oroxyli TaxID=366584 RepID=A0A1G8ADZ8_PSEOR|nr:hypothetical protein [Pseudonocardia oroxyli]SDH19192.1 hypothetical protein SAMN05216377_12016 [Pseudonocardia oroxyli]